ncbi:MAG: cellulase family glycosylhydrolase [Microscillaceae bacterium]|nr:cellulase family glycosylhydrolase [Microscillaceae bacterium]MDW8460928.1 cellulase family glycosylhydrolase [Cytophagales bacterium]
MLQIKNRYFVDTCNRLVHFRGINLSNNSKFPFLPPLPTNESRNLYSTKTISFQGRPFPLQEADNHLRRLKYLGFNLIRLLVVWEAICPNSPENYDERYLDYLVELVKKMREYEFYVLIDAHQETWSRFSGGSGAPMWTFEQIGFEVRQFHEAGAAFMHQHTLHYNTRFWEANYAKLASATMFTLFFAGSDFAPLTCIQGENIQHYLQKHYLKAFQQVALRLASFDHVLGFEVMNEPSAGWIGQQDIRQLETQYRFGAMPTPLEAMASGSGNVCKVSNYTFDRWGRPKLKGKVLLNHRGIKVWQNGVKCIWKQHEVWDIDKNNLPVALKPNYFAQKHGQKVDFIQQYYLPFVKRFVEMIHRINPNKWIGIHQVREQPPLNWQQIDIKQAFFAFAWTDQVTCRTQKYHAWLNYDHKQQKILCTQKAIMTSFATQVKEQQEKATQLNKNAPAICIKTGIPFNLNKQKAYKTNNFDHINQALDFLLKALESQQQPYVLWNYTHNNRNDYGDGWNLEDYSIFSLSQRGKERDLYTGIRAIEALARPYPLFLAGKLTCLEFDYKKHILKIVFEHFEGVHAPTEIFLPEVHFPEDSLITVSDGKFEFMPYKQKLIYHHSIEKFIHTITIKRN